MAGDDPEPLRHFAADLRDASDRLLAALDGPGQTSAPAGPPETLDQLLSRLVAAVPGRQQKAVLGLVGLYTDEGMTTDQVRRALELADPAQAFQPLQRLRARGLVEEVPAAEPKRWRVSERNRRRLGESAGQPA
jgi:hypothetical protein